MALHSELSAVSLLRQLNGIDPAIYCTAASTVSASFRVRGATRRIYRYFEPGRGPEVRSWSRAAAEFRGPIDVRSFGRGIPAGAPVWRTVEEVTVAEVEGGLQVEIRAPSFVWGMVRKMVGALREHEAGRLSLRELGDAVRGKSRLTLPMAEPQGLVLWRVEYVEPWEFFWNGPNRHQLARYRRERERPWIRSRVLDALAPTAPGRGSGPRGAAVIDERLPTEEE